MKNKIYYIIIFIFILLILLVGAYYINGKIIDSRTFELIGSKEIVINLGDKWEDPGYIYKDKDKDLHDEVKVSSNVDLTKIGNYEIIYSIKVGILSNSINRVVKVVDSKANTSFYFFLKGTPNVYLLNGKEYIEPGYDAIDNKDGNITSKVIKSGTVDNTKDGTYELKYQITNSNGITKEKTRKVIVYSFNFSGSIKYDEVVKENEILINITEDNYQYTVLPDGTKSTEKNIIYKVNKNGTYVFTIYDKHNSTFRYEAVVSNIDVDKPTGSCEMVLKNNGATINVTATDNGKIKGYKYKYGTVETELKESNKLDITTMDEKSSVTIYDEADNKVTVTCKVINKSTTINRSYKSQAFTTSKDKKYEYWLYEPKHSAREKMPLLVYFHGDGGRKSLNSVNDYAYPSFISKGEDYPFYMIAPHVDSTDDFGTDARMEKTVELINYIVKNYDIDASKIIVSGGSSGSRGAYRMAATYKNMFFCMVIGSGILYQLNDKELTHLPIWFFHGEKDGIDYRDIERHVNNINSLGGNAKLTVIKGGGHNITETVFKRDDLISWMVAQKKK